jgi:hypothetical protein
VFHYLAFVQCTTHHHQQLRLIDQNMTSSTQESGSDLASTTSRPRHAFPEYDVFVQSVNSAGAGLVRCHYAGTPKLTFPILSHTEASEILKIPLQDITSAMQLRDGFTFRTVVPLEFAHKQATAATLGKFHRLYKHTGHDLS